MNDLDSFDSRAESTVQHLRILGRTAFLQYVLTVSPIRVSEAFPAKCAGARELPEIMRRRLPVLARLATPDRACEHATL